MTKTIAPAGDDGDGSTAEPETGVPDVPRRGHVRAPDRPAEPEDGARSRPRLPPPEVQEPGGGEAQSACMARMLGVQNRYWMDTGIYSFSGPPMTLRTFAHRRSFRRPCVDSFDVCVRRLSFPEV